MYMNYCSQILCGECYDMGVLAIIRRQINLYIMAVLEPLQEAIDCDVET